MSTRSNSGKILLSLVILIFTSISLSSLVNAAEVSKIIDFTTNVSWTTDNTYKYANVIDQSKTTAFVSTVFNFAIPEPQWLYYEDFSSISGWTQPSGSGGGACSASGGLFVSPSNSDCDYRFGAGKNFANTELYFEWDWMDSSFTSAENFAGWKTSETGWSPRFGINAPNGGSNYKLDYDGPGANVNLAPLTTSVWRRMGIHINSTRLEACADNSTNCATNSSTSPTNFYTTGIKALYVDNAPWSGDHFRVWNQSKLNNGNNIVVTKALEMGGIGTSVLLDWDSSGGTSVKASLNNGSTWTTLSDGVATTVGSASGHVMLNISLGTNQKFTGRFNITLTLVQSLPPNILTINLTSEGGAGQLVNISDKNCTNSGCVVPSTYDTLPTFKLDTDLAANCRIGIDNWNYTRMGSWRNCSGAGTTSHTCTISELDELVYEDSLIYFGCISTADAENASSTSGGVTIRITGLESAGDISIGLGVQNALLTGYSNLTNQQLSTRALSGTQKLGRFDWVAKKGTKVWAFNFVTKGEQHTLVSNITPNIYVLEISNVTTTNITKYVETMMNATK